MGYAGLVLMAARPDTLSLMRVLPHPRQSAPNSGQLMQLVVSSRGQM